MKHWHRCDRWTKQGFEECPFSGIAEHEGIEGPEDELDRPQEPAVPIGVPGPVGPFPPAKVEKREMSKLG